MDRFFLRVMLLTFILSWGTAADARQASNDIADAPDSTEVEQRKSHFASDRQRRNDSSGEDSKAASPTVNSPRDSILGMDPTVGLFVVFSAGLALAAAIIACAKDSERGSSTPRPFSGPPDAAKPQSDKKKG